MKTCFKCSKKLPARMFYKHPMMKDGRLNKCKECTKKDTKKHYRDNLDARKAYERKRAQLPHRKKLRWEYSQTEAGKESAKRSKKRWIENNLIKRAVHIMTGNAIRNGGLVKQPCETCGSKKVHAHHDDYNNPMDVRWLCPKHHAQIHKQQLSEDQEHE